MLVANPRYFTDDSGKAIYLTGSHTWNNLLDGGWPLGASAFDYDGYLAFLAAHEHNFVRLWTPETGAHLDLSASAERFVEPVPYLRTGPGTALDGRPRFDLERLNEAYFARLRARVSAARERGIYVSVMLFNNWGTSGYPGIAGTWRGHFYNAANNVNGVDGDPNGDGRGVETHSLALPAVTALQKAYIRKLVDSVNDLDNVLYEISNESHGAGASEWQYELIAYIKRYEAGKPKQHPVGMTPYWEPEAGWGNERLQASPADWISPADVGQAYSLDPPAADGGRVIVADTDHLSNNLAPWGSGATRAWVWRSFTRGINPIYMDRIPELGGALQHRYPQPAHVTGTRRAMGHTRAYAERMNLAAMTPRGDLSSTAYALADPGSEYLVYQPGSGGFTVDLATGKYALEWFNPATGEASAGDTIAVGGGKRSFTPPFAGDAVLYVKSA